PVVAVAGDGGVDEARVLGREPIVVELETPQHLGADVGDERVGTCDQLARDAPTFDRRQIEGDASLAAVVELEGRIHRRLLADRADEQAAEGITVGRLDLDDLGAPVGEHPARGRTGHPEAELDHAYPVHRARHRHPAARSASISSTCFGAAALSTSCPPAVTRTSSSMRMPMPRKASGTSAAFAGMYSPGST